jgi:hypothetical protein
VINPARRLRLVILDACRENPFERTMKRSIATRAIGRGLAQVEPPTGDTLIAFAAKAGSTAADGNETNSLFTTALVNHLATPGLDVRLALGLVRDEVMARTNHKQETGSLVLRQVGGYRAGEIAVHRFLSSPHVTPRGGGPNGIGLRGAADWRGQRITHSTRCRVDQLVLDD